MADPQPARPSPSDRARRTARLTVCATARTTTAPLRALARLGRPDSDPRWPAAAWLWQPGWGRGAHDRLYRRPDPYGIGLSPYEQQKYGTVMDTLAGHRFARALEVGCGEGDLSVRLAGHTDALVGVDICPAAVERAARRVPSATFARRTLPREMPDGTFDLIVCTDVLYYWEPVTLRVGIAALLDRLRPGGTLLAYHYRGDFGQAGTADRVHEALRAAATARGHVVSRHETRDGVGPGAAGARFDVVVAPAPVGDRPVTGVPEPRRPVTGTPAPSPRS
ncbi:methyltransferase domain-containing protein [Pseudonocardia sp. C8]|uniref:class I SAM-dependent DNA methyltransferase n=1 Tax=Pseudonocardia sp. C8 TaxID=2762759 RepID=UPI00164292DF|nr:SAM-dependent methyltransferase [Pseudonocardia sp. C8]MBC3194721.1 methyltransferase domain-containing protein [Pseudonocardia sp. C8]